MTFFCTREDINPERVARDLDLQLKSRVGAQYCLYTKRSGMFVDTIHYDPVIFITIPEIQEFQHIIERARALPYLMVYQGANHIHTTDVVEAPLH